MKMRKIIILMCGIFICFSINSCTSVKDRKTEKFIKSVLITKICEYPYNNYSDYVYDDLKYSKLNDSISYYILNYYRVDDFGVKRLSFTFGYFNMNTGCDVSDVEEHLDDDSSNRFINTQLYGVQ